jgi:hypothetical protein
MLDLLLTILGGMENKLQIVVLACSRWSINDTLSGVTIEGSRLKERCKWRNKRKGFLEEMM